MCRLNDTTAVNSLKKIGSQKPSYSPRQALRVLLASAAKPNKSGWVLGSWPAATVALQRVEGQLQRIVKGHLIDIPVKGLGFRV